MFKNNKSNNTNNNNNINNNNTNNINKINNKKELNKTTIKVSIITLLLLIPLYSSYSNSCITKDKYGNIVYNTKSKNNKCLLIRSVNSNERNELTEYGKNKLGTPDSIGGGACIIDNSKIQSIILANGNTDNLEGKLINNNSNISISCKKGYDGSLNLICNNNIISYSGSCSLSGCVKYVDNVINPTYSSALDGINFTLTTSNKEILKNSNKDVIYNKGDVIETISCIDSQYLINNSGYSINCGGNNRIGKTGRGCTRGVEFNYTGSVQSWTIPDELKGKKVNIELHGARGGSSCKYENNNEECVYGSHGGYTKITGVLTNKVPVGSTLYIVVGGAGEDSNRSGRDRLGGYNGGSFAYGNYRDYDKNIFIYSGAGGGATHIATVSGQLKDLKSYLSSDGKTNDKVLAVAGGGGGANYGNKNARATGAGGNRDGGSYNVSTLEGNGGFGANSNCPDCDAVKYGNITYKEYINNPSKFCGDLPKQTVSSFGEGGSSDYNSSGAGGGFYGGGGAVTSYSITNSDGICEKISNLYSIGGGGSGYCDSSFSCIGLSGIGTGGLNNGKVTIRW